MAQVQNVKKVTDALQARKAKANQNKNVSVSVGYTQAYAIYVHENLEAHHPIGQAKFLEQPARELEGELASIVRESLDKGRTLAQSLLIAGLTIQRASQKLVPIDTGALKNSAFTRLDQGK